MRGHRRSKVSLRVPVDSLPHPLHVVPYRTPMDTPFDTIIHVRALAFAITAPYLGMESLPNRHEDRHPAEPASRDRQRLAPIGRAALPPTHRGTSTVESPDRPHEVRSRKADKVASAAGSDAGTTAVVTGAFGYSGHHIAQLLLRRGVHVRTLTNHPVRQLDGTRIEVHSLDFLDERRLRAALRGASVMYNTYWIRFAEGPAGHERAVANSKVLIDAALAEGVGHFVHVSIANADQAPSLSYYRGKAAVEEHLRGSGLAFSIVRPTLLYGHGDILLNNIAWFLRHLPVFGIPGDGDYAIQPVFVEDYADLIVEIGQRASSGTEIDAVGPDTYTFSELVALLRGAVSSRCVVMNVPPRLARGAANLVGRALRDTVLSGEEIDGLMAGLLVSRGAPTCSTQFEAWLAAAKGGLGHKYASELARRVRL